MAEPFIGEIYMVGFNFAPRGFAFCSGQLLSIAQNTALFSLLGTNFGGNGQTTFGLPDLRGRVPMHFGQGPGLPEAVLGEKAGVEFVTLISTEMPAHSHTATPRCSSANGNSNTPAGNVWSKNGGLQGVLNTSQSPNSAMTPSVTLAATSGGQPHTNLQPTLCVNFVIALEGIYPSRN